MDVFLLIEKGCGTILTFIFLMNGSRDCPNFSFASIDEYWD